jgi:hypothetical protein
MNETLELPERLPVTLSLGDQGDQPFVWIDCTVRGCRHRVVTMTPRAPLTPRLRERLDASEAGYLVFEVDGAPLALKGLARAVESGFTLEFLTRETAAGMRRHRADGGIDAPLLRLMYVSQAAAGLTSRDFDAILAEADRRNVATEVTGALCLHGGFFGQILEGPAQTVRETFALIESDPRHREPIVLIEEPARYRLYGGWTMRGIDGRNAVTAAEELSARLALAQRGDSAEVTRRWLSLLQSDGGPSWASAWLSGRQSVLVLRELVSDTAPPAESQL